MVTKMWFNGKKRLFLHELTSLFAYLRHLPVQPQASSFCVQYFLKNDCHMRSTRVRKINVANRRLLISQILIIALALLLSTKNHAQQHQPELKWMTLKTAHFSIHYPAGYESIADKIAHICEEVYQPVGQSLHYFPHRTQVVVHTRSDVSNGYVVQLPWRMELFINEPQDNTFGSNEEWLHILITHEMTHVVQARKVRGLSRLSYPFFGELNSFWHHATPNWYVEGFATLNETRLTQGGRGRNAYHRMKMMAPLIDGQPWPLANTSFLSRKRLPLDMSYVAGYYFSEYIAEKYGDDAWERIFDRYNANPLPGFGHAVKKVTGRKPEAHYRKLLAQLKETVPHHTDRSLPLRRTELPENQYSPKWDGERIIYYRNSYDDLPEIAAIGSNGEQQHILQRTLFGTETALAISKNWLVWSELSSHPRYSATEYACLKVYDRRANAIRSLTDELRLYSPDIAPDEKSVVAVQSALPTTRLVRIDMEGGAVAPLLAIPKATLLNPRWSPDGRFIAFAIKDSTNQQDIAILDLEKRDWRRVTPSDHFHDNSPCWSPDGRYIFYTSDRSGIFNIWAVQVATGQQWQVTDVSTGAFAPDVSADGQQLAFALYTELGFQVRTLALQHRNWLPAVPATDSPQFSNPPKSQAASVDTSNWQRGSYRALWQILRPQGWFPWAVEDENGTAFGLFAISEDALHQHAWSGFLTFSPANLKPSWDASYSYRKWWPELRLRSYSDVDAIGLLRGPNNSTFDGWLRNTGLELTAAVPLAVNRNTYTTFFRPLLGMKGENINLFARGYSPGVEGVEVKNGMGHYRGWKAGMQFYHASQAFRDIVPHKAIFVSSIGDWSSAFLKSNIAAQQISTAVNAYYPALFKHHTWQLQLGFTMRSGNLGFSSFRSYPIGYGDPGRRKLLRVKAAYHFPVAYSEWQMPFLPIFLHTLSGAFFWDWGTSWNHGTGATVWNENALSSAGVLLSANISLFQTISMQVGLVNFYQDAKRKFAIKPVIGLNF